MALRILDRGRICGSHVAAALSLSALLLCLAACNNDTSTAAEPPAAPPSVGVVAAERKVVSLGDEYVGRVTAIDKVELRARVAGFLTKRQFQEGQLVAAGDLLFAIEPDQYQAQVDQARANLASAEANRVNTDQQLRRDRALLKTNAIAAAAVDERVAQDAQAQASVLQQKAALQLAELSLGYTEIRSPIAGRIGVANLSVGNLVDSSSGVLATILSEDPIYVTFSVSARKLFEVAKRAIERGENPRDATITIRLPDGSPYAHPGKVNYVDDQVNRGSDTVMIRAQFPNPDHQLLDGQYASTTVEIEKPAPALVIPQSALQTDQTGRYVLVVDPANKVIVRRVDVRATLAAGAVIETGLSEGERVVVQGLQKVRPGQTVDPTTIPAAIKS